jgi:hypothetical protein
VAKILFVMPEPGYLRLYSTTVTALAERGHDVQVSYERQAKPGRDAGDLREASPNLRVIAPAPPHGGVWRTSLTDMALAIVYVRFLSTRDGTAYLRGRMERYLPAPFHVLKQAGSWPHGVVHALFRVTRLVERAVPVDAALVRYLRDLAPDAMVLTPLVLRGPGGAQQTQLLKAARHLGIPVALAVGSWDHLSSKGFIRVRPDRVLVWNEIQRREAQQMHDVPADRVIVTGAQPFDHWFTIGPSLDAAAFRARVGLPHAGPMLLYAGSSRGITPPDREIPFVRAWLSAVRASADPVLRSAPVLIRPHLGNVDAWADVDLSDFAPVSIFPRQRPRLPMTDLETADYFHSMHFSTAVVGVNTSAMIEASILDRPVLTVQTDAFRDTQAGTKHFHYLLPEAGGCVLSAETFEAHVRQLSAAVADPGAGREMRARFVEQFVRPRGRHRPALDSVIEAIEQLPAVRAEARSTVPAWLAPVRWAFRLAMSRVSASG